MPSESIIQGTRIRKKFKIAATRSTLYAMLLAMLIFLAAVNSGINLLFMVSSFLIATLVFNAITAWLALPPAGLRLNMADNIHAGTPLEVQLIYTTRMGPLPKAFEATVLLSGKSGSTSWSLSSAPANYVIFGKSRSRDIILRIDSPSRGRYDIAQVRLRSSFPFGLLEARRTISMDIELYIYPRLIEVARHQLMPASAKNEVSKPTRRRSNMGSVPLSIREHRPGDPLRHIHWKASAHKGSIMVKELEREEFLVAAILLCLKLSDRQDKQLFDAELEKSLELAASYTRLLLNRGFTVQLIGYIPQRIQIPPGRGAKYESEVLRILAEAQRPAEDYTDAIIADLKHKALSTSTVIMISDHDDKRCRELISQLQLAGYRVIQGREEVKTG